MPTPFQFSLIFTQKGWLVFALFGLLLSCAEPDLHPEETYTVSGRITDNLGQGLPGIPIYHEMGVVSSDTQGYWRIPALAGSQVLTPRDSQYRFSPASLEVKEAQTGLLFTGTWRPSAKEKQILNWLNSQQLPNGLLESTENNNVVSLYDQALAALTFMRYGDFERAERIFDFFNGRIESELRASPGGFSQFRDRNGTPGKHRWMGDNAWLLIALNNYQAWTQDPTYDELATEISKWLISLQAADGGLYAGYATDNSLLNYKVTEGNIDAFNAVKGYSSFHQDILSFLKNDRWDASDGNLMAWPENPPYRYALDNHSWSFCIFPDYPVASLLTADRFLTTQTATVNAARVTGYDIDEDRDAVFLEGTGQMALAFRLAGLEEKSAFYLREMEKVFIPSSVHPQAAGFPYASNRGTGYGDTPLWQGADTQIAISAGAWYLFALRKFNPFAVEREKEIPPGDRFW